MRAIGPQPDGAPWRIGIRHPRDAGAAVAGSISPTGAVATSGDYERYFEIGGRRYCHILESAAPGCRSTHWQSISVVAPLCVVAGSCATIAMLLEGGAREFLEAQGMEWLGVASDGSLLGPARAAGP